MSGGSGGDTYDPMEVRVAQLEAHVGHIRGDVTEIKAGIKDLGVSTSALKVEGATLTERVAHLPSKGFIVSSVLAALAVATALVLFQGNLQRMVGLPTLAPVTAPLK